MAVIFGCTNKLPTVYERSLFPPINRLSDRHSPSCCRMPTFHSTSFLRCSNPPAPRAPSPRSSSAILSASSRRAPTTPRHAYPAGSLRRIPLRLVDSRLARLVVTEWKAAQRMCWQRRIINPDRDLHFLAFGQGYTIDDDPSVRQHNNSELMLLHDQPSIRGYLGTAAKRNGRNRWMPGIHSEGLGSHRLRVEGSFGCLAASNRCRKYDSRSSHPLSSDFGPLLLRRDPR